MEVTHSAFTLAKATEQVETEEEWVEWDGSERESETETSQMVEELVDESMESFSNTVDSLL